MVLSGELRDYLTSLYFNPEKPGAFRSPLQLWRQVKKENKYKIGLPRIKQWLQNQDVYSINRTVRRRFKRPRVFTGGIKDQYDADLMDVGFHSKENDGIKYLLVVIDVFTRYVWLCALKNKTSSNVLKGLKNCFQNLGFPRKIRTDAGKEFTAHLVQNYLKSVEVTHFTTQGESKSNFVERVIRTLRSLMHRYMKKTRSFRYIDKLQTLVTNYNHTPHRSLGYKAPSEINETNEVDQIILQYFKSPVKRKIKKVSKLAKKLRSSFRFKVGDTVRISHLKHVFERKFMEKFTGEVFKIKSRFLKQNIPMYKLQDLRNEDLTGSFYEQELQKIEKLEDTLWEVEKILRKRRRNNQTYVLIKWLNFPRSFNSWMPESEVQELV
ncbi:uncharacterized protein LOC133202165 [Saccostrea echinata]|uniref:uncharacterized protein LOC133202165 n=1 Tax=Saccostrea echinata TaxID=191078 RepID=UPI002A807E05|nr:uncharacterized protein LOC133202165 [Saccostrea echinata]